MMGRGTAEMGAEKDTPTTKTIPSMPSRRIDERYSKHGIFLNKVDKPSAQPQITAS
jgi:hypothetical protein